eukprot:c12887_g1_i1 orf=2-205(-)
MGNYNSPSIFRWSRQKYHTKVLLEGTTSLVCNERRHLQINKAIRILHIYHEYYELPGRKPVKDSTFSL